MENRDLGGFPDEQGNRKKQSKIFCGILAPIWLLPLISSSSIAKKLFSNSELTHARLSSTSFERKKRGEYCIVHVVAKRHSLAVLMAVQSVIPLALQIIAFPPPCLAYLAASSLIPFQSLPVAPVTSRPASSPTSNMATHAGTIPGQPIWFFRGTIVTLYNQR